MIRRRYDRRPPRSDEPRMNERIRVREVRLIEADGTQVGVVDTRDAFDRAREAGLDLVEVAAEARPPVCKIMDYGKYKYEQKKKTAKAHKTQLKEVRLRPHTDDHDYNVKLERAKRFLAKGDKVQLVLMFRGRQMAHKDLGRKLLERMVTDLHGLAKVERAPKQEGRRMTMLLSHK